jgi:hypothetical protein
MSVTVFAFASTKLMGDTNVPSGVRGRATGDDPLQGLHATGTPPHGPKSTRVGGG